MLKPIALLKISVILSWFMNSDAISRLGPLVSTNLGLIRGLEATDGDYSMFLGIPYAKVPETNPFGPSSPHGNFIGIFEAYYDSAICAQINNNNIIGIIDCLHLNIYVPNSASTKNPLPVMVWIHGGAFTSGSANKEMYGPKYLIRHDVILVTLTYRVGTYGFMCLNIPEVPGNQGLKDQLLAMRWVSDNIEAFGGDPNLITLFGESAGGRSVDFHLMFGEDGLFHRAIMQSTTSISPPVIGEPDDTVPLMLANQVGLDTNNVREAVSFLGMLDPELVLEATNDLGIDFKPCVENDFENVEKFVSDYTINRNVSKVKDIPIILGFNDDERLVAYVNRDPSSYVGLDLFNEFLRNYFNFDEIQQKEMEELVRKFYIGDKNIDVNVKRGIVDFDSDFTYLHPTHRRVDQYLENGAQKIYYYVFSYIGQRNFVRVRLNINIGGAVHADELGYLFDIQNTFDETSPEDQLTFDRMTTMWTNFAKYGDPTPETSNLLPVKWEPVTKDIRYYYSIDTELCVKNRPFTQRMTFWDVFFMLNEKYQIGYKEK